MHPSLGKTFRDIITGFVGVAVGRCEYISGCNQILLAPKAKDGAHVDSHWFDEQRCEEGDTPRITLFNGRTPGFDKAAPKI